MGELNFFEWDGESCLGTNGFYDWLFELPAVKENTLPNNVNGYCDCFHAKRCCSLTVDDQKVRAGDQIHYRDGKLELVRGDTEPFICPTHNIEHSGTGTYLCITTGENA